MVDFLSLLPPLDLGEEEEGGGGGGGEDLVGWDRWEGGGGEVGHGG